MELAIAIWKDCKRLLTDNQPITCNRLQPFADIKVHVELDAKIRVVVKHAHLNAVKDDGAQGLHRLHGSVVALVYDCRRIDVVILNDGRVELVEHHVLAVVLSLEHLHETLAAKLILIV